MDYGVPDSALNDADQSLRANLRATAVYLLRDTLQLEQESTKRCSETTPSTSRYPHEPARQLDLTYLEIEGLLCQARTLAADPSIPEASIDYGAPALDVTDQDSQLDTGKGKAVFPGEHNDDIHLEIAVDDELDDDSIASIEDPEEETALGRQIRESMMHRGRSHSPPLHDETSRELVDDDDPDDEGVEQGEETEEDIIPRIGENVVHRGPPRSDSPVPANIVSTTEKPARAPASGASSAAVTDDSERASQAIAVNPPSQDAAILKSTLRVVRFHQGTPEIILPKEQNEDVTDGVPRPSASRADVGPYDENEEAQQPDDFAPTERPVRRNPTRRAALPLSGAHAARDSSVPPMGARVQPSRKMVVEVLVPPTKLSKANSTLNVVEFSGVSKGKKRKVPSDDDHDDHEPTAAVANGRQTKRLKRNVSLEGAAQPDGEIVEQAPRRAVRSGRIPRKALPLPRPMPTVESEDAEADKDKEAFELKSAPADKSAHEQSPVRPVAGGRNLRTLPLRHRPARSVSEKHVQSREAIVTSNIEEGAMHGHTLLPTAVTRRTAPIQVTDVDDNMEGGVEPVYQEAVDIVMAVSDNEDVEMIIASSPPSRRRTTRSMSAAVRSVTERAVTRVTENVMKKMTEKANEAVEREKSKRRKSGRTMTRSKEKTNLKKTARK
ncbi:hypothetical protein CALCODRAFT_500292 [Calocera cornea HHB12733]|uniref:Uncharacterized protein n=1 Tax=Calocera cornea HHB12733 TaxID=1353952 RepID=A0A165E425_9BASI|nr:hypothetical protein CALCODRAFT_500292 [Calocera cornea HHB12733]